MASKGANSSDQTMQAFDKNGNAYKIRMSLMLAAEDEEKIGELLTPFDRRGQIVDVNVKSPDDEPLYADSVNKPVQASGRCITPAMCVIAHQNDRYLESRMVRKPAWKHHHTVEGKHKQVFFQLGSGHELPLFGTVLDPTSEEHLVFQIYVHRYKEMKTFYSAIAQTEDESSVEGLCVFELYKRGDRLIKLKLKQCQYIYPVPVKSAYVSFNVTSVNAIQNKLGVKFEHDVDNVYSTSDPDGNIVVLYETSEQEQAAFAELADKFERTILPFSPSVVSLCSFDDVTSVTSTSDSNDSGTASDIDSKARVPPPTLKRPQPKGKK